MSGNDLDRWDRTLCDPALGGLPLMDRPNREILRPSTASGRELGSVLVGYFDDGELHYAGKVGTGFGSEEGSQLITRLRKHERKQSPFKEVPRAAARDARWAEPVLVAEVEFTSLTRDRYFRHRSLRGCARTSPRASRR
jgi:bifunctional non-homologous end joining protein LigD